MRLHKNNLPEYLWFGILYVCPYVSGIVLTFRDGIQTCTLGLKRE